MASRLFLGVLLVMASGLCLLASISSAHAASFACTSARSALEKQICGDAALSKADELVADVYRVQFAATLLLRPDDENRFGLKPGEIKGPV